MDFRDWLSAIVYAIAVAFGIGIVAFILVFAVEKMTEGQYIYTDTNGNTGEAINCYTSDIMYCRKDDNTNVQVIEYRKVG